VLLVFSSICSVSVCLCDLGVSVVGKSVQSHPNFFIAWSVDCRAIRCKAQSVMTGRVKLSSSFSQTFGSVHDRIESLARGTAPIPPLTEIVHEARAQYGLDAAGVAALMALAVDPERRAEIHNAAKRIRGALAPATVEFVIPVYLTNYCKNDCLYCGYRKSNALTERRRLSLEDFDRVLDVILAWGHRQIELVLSEDPEFGPEVVARYVALARRRLGALGGASSGSALRFMNSRIMCACGTRDSSGSSSGRRRIIPPHSSDGTRPARPSATSTIDWTCGIG